MHLRPLRATLAAAPPALLPAVAVALLALAGGCRRAAPAPSDPETIVERVRERAAEDFAGIENFTVEGGGVLLYFRRAEAATDSLPAFDLRIAPLDPATPPSIEPSYYYPVTLSRVIRGLQRGARLVGQDTLAGRRVYVLEAPDPASLVDLPPIPTVAGSTTARVFADAETFRLVGFRASLTPQLDSTVTARPVVETHRFYDFQEDDGLTLPRRSRTTIEGIDQLIPQEMRMIAGGNLALRRAQATRLPPAERERELAAIAREEQRLQTGVQETPFAVGQVRINAGVPDSLFIERLSPLLRAPAAP